MKTYAIWKYEHTCPIPEETLGFWGVFDLVQDALYYNKPVECTKVYEGTDLKEAMNVWHGTYEGEVETSFDTKNNLMHVVTTEINEYEDGEFQECLDWSSEEMIDE